MPSDMGDEPPELEGTVTVEIATSEASNSSPTQRHMFPWDRAKDLNVPRPWSLPLRRRWKSVTGAASRAPSHGPATKGPTCRRYKAVPLIYQPMSRNSSSTATISGRAPRFRPPTATPKMSHRHGRSPSLRGQARRPATHPKVSAGRRPDPAAARHAYAERAPPPAAPLHAFGATGAGSRNHAKRRAHAPTARHNSETS